MNLVEPLRAVCGRQGMYVETLTVACDSERVKQGMCRFVRNADDKVSIDFGENLNTFFSVGKKKPAGA